jgi:hypothetical protein
MQARSRFATTRSFRRRPLALAVTAALAATAGAPLALAQSDSLDTIVVTATRREVGVQDIPLNIAAFDGALLQSRQITDLADLGRNVPGLYVVDQGKRSANNIVVRGLNVNQFQSAEFLGNTGGQTVATYVGDIPLYVDLALNDVERVEVLLGPQGTLYGAGTLGGAVRYIARKPQFDDTTLDVRGSTFSLSESDSFGWRGGATFNLPLGDNLALRASIDEFDDPGFIDAPYLVRQPGISDPEPNFANPSEVAANLYSLEDVDTENTTSARVSLRWQPLDTVDATFTYHYQNMEVGGRTQNHVAAFGTGRYESATRYPEPNDRTNELLSAEIIADLGFAELTSATGFARYDEMGQRDQTDLLITLEFSYEAFPSFSAFTREIEKEETFTQELRLVSQSDGRWNWIGGLFFLDFEQPEGVSREFTPRYDAYLGGSRPDQLEYISVLQEDRREKALFGEVGYQITDQWRVTLGGRLYDYEFTTRSGFDLPLFNTLFLGAGENEINVVLSPKSQEADGSLFKLNTSYDFSDDVMGYATISQRHRSLPESAARQSGRLHLARRVRVPAGHHDQLRSRRAQSVAGSPSHIERRRLLHRLAEPAAHLRDRERQSADHEERRRRGVARSRILARRSGLGSPRHRLQLRAHAGGADGGREQPAARYVAPALRQSGQLHRRPARRSPAWIARGSSDDLRWIRLEPEFHVGSHAQLRRDGHRRRHLDDGPARRRREARRLQPAQRLGRLPQRPVGADGLRTKPARQVRRYGPALQSGARADRGRRKRRPGASAILCAADAAAARARLELHVLIRHGAIGIAC